MTYLVSLKALDSLFLLLLSQNDERSAVLVKCKTHVVFSSCKYKKAILVSLNVEKLYKA